MNCLLKNLNHKRNIALRLLILRTKIFLYKALKSKSSINFTSNNKVVIYLGKGIGDCIILSGLIKGLRSSGYHVSVITEKKCAFIFDELIDVDHVILKENKLQLKGYDIFIDPYDQAHKIPAKMRLILKSELSLTIGFNTYIYDKNIAYNEYKEHFCSRFKYIIDILNCSNADTATYLNTHKKTQKQIDEWFNNSLCNKELVIICPFTSNPVRNFSVTQCAELLNHFQNKPKYQVVILGSHEQLARLPSELRTKFIIDPQGSFYSAVELIKKASLVISADTVFVHISKIFNKKLIAVYNNRIIDGAFENNYVFSPNYEYARIVYTSDRLHTADGDFVANLDTTRILDEVKNVL